MRERAWASTASTQLFLLLEDGWVVVVVVVCCLVWLFGVCMVRPPPQRHNLDRSLGPQKYARSTTHRCLSGSD